MAYENLIKSELTGQAIYALENLNTYAHVLEFGMTPDGIVNWLGACNEDHPTQEEIDIKVIELQEAYDAQEYARNRKEEYPPMEDQLDYMYHNGFEKWKTDMIDPIKDKYPKSE